MKGNQETITVRKGRGGGGVVVALSHKNAGRTSIQVLEREGMRWNQEIITVRKAGGGGGGG